MSHVTRKPAARILHQRFENLEPRTSRRTETAVHDSRDQRRVLPRLQRGDRLEAAAIFVADGKAIQQILDGHEAGVREIGGAARADAFQKLQRRRERVGGHPSRAERPKLY